MSKNICLLGQHVAILDDATLCDVAMMILKDNLFGSGRFVMVIYIAIYLAIHQILALHNFHRHFYIHLIDFITNIIDFK